MKYLIVLLLTIVSVKAGTISWDDTNNPAGTRYVISNKLNNGPWLWYTNTPSKSNNFVVLSPGTNWFSVTATNGLISDPSTTNGVVPFKVINIIIEARTDLGTPGTILTNMEQLVAVKQDVNEFFLVKTTIR